MIIILGMHRSGTSSLAGMLHSGGIIMGDKLIRPQPDNPKGFFEDFRTLQINELILASIGREWNIIPEKSELKNVPKEILKLLPLAFQNFHSRFDKWGWKDPRFCITFPLWADAIPLKEIHLLFILRHPMSVANSLYIRNQIPIETGMELWAGYNKNISEILDYYKLPYTFIRYESLIKNPETHQKILERHLKVQLGDCWRFIDHKLNRSELKTSPLPEHINNFYEELISRWDNTTWLLQSLDDLDLKEGENFFEKGDLENARRYFNKVLEKYPDHAEAYNNLGVIEFKDNNHVDAISLFNRSLELDNNYFDALINKADCLKNIGNYNDALREYSRALNFDLNNIGILNSLGECFINLKDYRNAYYFYSTSLGLDNNQTLVKKIVEQLENWIPGDRDKSGSNLQGDAPINAIKPKLTSIIILTFNELEYTKKCLQSIIQHTSVPYELIIVDNGSTDGTRNFLEEYRKAHNECKIILNKMNRGFAGGNNQGISEATGDYILLLNNDTVVTERWLERLIEHIESDTNIGMAGPVSNSVSGPQLVENIEYGENLVKMNNFAQSHYMNNVGKTQDVLRLVGFCLLIKRQVIDIIGVLDEDYGNGNFEDDDLCMRSHIAGFRNIIVHDVFIHHYGSITFKGNSIDYNSSMQNNWKRFIDKWKGVIEAIDDSAYRVIMNYEGQLNKLIYWGEESFSQGNLRSALKIFERALQLDPKNSQALNKIGVMQWELGDPNGAIKTFQSTLNNNPEDSDALENLIQATMGTGEFDFIDSDLLETAKKVKSENPNLVLMEQRNSSGVE